MGNTEKQDLGLIKPINIVKRPVYSFNYAQKRKLF